MMRTIWFVYLVLVVLGISGLLFGLCCGLHWPAIAGLLLLGPGLLGVSTAGRAVDAKETDNGVDGA